MDECPRILLSCFIERNSGSDGTAVHSPSHSQKEEKFFIACESFPLLEVYVCVYSSGPFTPYDEQESIVKGLVIDMFTFPLIYASLEIHATLSDKCCPTGYIECTSRGWDLFSHLWMDGFGWIVFSPLQRIIDKFGWKHIGELHCNNGWKTRLLLEEGLAEIKNMLRCFLYCARAHSFLNESRIVSAERRRRVKGKR